MPPPGGPLLEFGTNLATVRLQAASFPLAKELPGIAAGGQGWVPAHGMCFQLRPLPLAPPELRPWVGPWTPLIHTPTHGLMSHPDLSLVPSLWTWLAVTGLFHSGHGHQAPDPLSWLDLSPAPSSQWYLMAGGCPQLSPASLSCSFGRRQLDRPSRASPHGDPRWLPAPKGAATLSALCWWRTIVPWKKTTDESNTRFLKLSATFLLWTNFAFCLLHRAFCIVPHCKQKCKPWKFSWGRLMQSQVHCFLKWKNLCPTVRFFTGFWLDHSQIALLQMKQDLSSDRH